MEKYHIDSLCFLRQQTCRDKFSDIVRGVLELRTTGKVVISISKHNYWPITVEPSGQPVATVALIGWLHVLSTMHFVTMFEGQTKYYFLIEYISLTILQGILIYNIQEVKE